MGRLEMQMLQVHPRREPSGVKYCFLLNFNFLEERGAMGSDQEYSEDDGMIEKV